MKDRKNRVEEYLRVGNKNIFEFDNVTYVTDDGIFSGKVIKIGYVMDLPEHPAVMSVLIKEEKYVDYDVIRVDDLIYICKESEEDGKTKEVYSEVVFEEYSKIIKAYNRAIRRGVKDLPLIEEVLKIVKDKEEWLTDKHKEKVRQMLEITDSLLKEMGN